MSRRARNTVYAVLTACIAVFAAAGFAGFPARAGFLSAAFGCSSALHVLLAVERWAAADLRRRSVPAAIGHVLAALILAALAAVCFRAYVVIRF